MPLYYYQVSVYLLLYYHFTEKLGSSKTGAYMESGQAEDSAYFIRRLFEDFDAVSIVSLSSLFLYEEITQGKVSPLPRSPQEQ
jgi:hypothetical protein